MKTIFDLPLQVILLAWLLRDHHKLDAHYLWEYGRMLDWLYFKRPIPHGWMAKWLTARLIEWIDRERGRVQLLLSLGFMLVGKLPE